jgi:hypothetical protein
MRRTMPRPKSDNDRQVTLLLPREAVEQADALAQRMAPPGARLTRTDALRAAVFRGLQALAEEHPAEDKAAKKKR